MRHRNVAALAAATTGIIVEAQAGIITNGHTKRLSSHLQLQLRLHQQQASRATLPAFNVVLNVPQPTDWPVESFDLGATF